MNQNPDAATLHDARLLHLLLRCRDQAESLEIGCTEEYSRDRNRCSLRFHTSVPDAIDPYHEGKSYLQIGVAQATTTGLFGLGNPVVHFFCFYPHRKENNHRDYLFNSCWYIYKNPWFSKPVDPNKRLKPYKHTLWQRLANLTHIITGHSLTGPSWFPQHTDPQHNLRLDEALQEAVFRAIQVENKQAQAKKLAGIKL